MLVDEASGIDDEKARRFGENCFQGLVDLQILTRKGTVNKKFTKKKLVPIFLNRLFGFHFKIQGELLQFFQNCLDFIGNDAAFANDKGIVDVAGSNFHISDREHLWNDKHGVPCELVEYTSDRGVSWTEAYSKYSTGKAQGRTAFFMRKKYPIFQYPHDSIRQIALAISLNVQYGRCQMFLVISYATLGPTICQLPCHMSFYEVISVPRCVPQGVLSYTYRRICRMLWELMKLLQIMCCRPNTGNEPKPRPRFELIGYSGIYDKVMLRNGNDVDDMRKLWTAQHQKYENTCMHKPGTTASFHKGPDCSWGRRKIKSYVLTGSMISSWNVVDRCLPTDGKKKIKIVRVSTPTERLVGIHVLEKKLGKKMKDFKAMFEAEIQWSVQLENGTWDDYSPELNDYLNNKKKGGSGACKFKLDNVNYLVDFNARMQIDLETSKKRSIRSAAIKDDSMQGQFAAPAAPFKASSTPMSLLWEDVGDTGVCDDVPTTVTVRDGLA